MTRNFCGLAIQTCCQCGKTQLHFLWSCVLCWIRKVFFVNPIHAVLRHRDMIPICDGAVIIRPFAKPGSDRIRPESDRIRPDQIGSDRIGSDWQNTDWINNKIPTKSRRSPDTVLKAGKVDFCVPSKCFFFPELITDSKVELWKIRCEELTSISELTACATVFFFKRENWQQFFTLPQSLTIAQ